ncbi:hypothetical protein BC832DRAFT_616368 [Gaertneriomyces semiglobifer]|nr:hypothetical protein BC832DRAFT_616368 [Gaertneriomyces semiglobifer]
MEGGDRGVDRVLKKLATAVQDGNYYEAHQMYHSVSRRYLKQGKVTDAVELLYQGAKNMLVKDQLGSAADLAQRLLEVYDSKHVPMDERSRGRLLDLFHHFPPHTSQCDDYVKLCLRWSTASSCPAGDPQLHHAFATRYYATHHYYEAETHFLYGSLDSAKLYAKMCWEWALEGYTTDKGYWVTRGVLGYLALRKLAHARALLSAFTALATTTADLQAIPIPTASTTTTGATGVVHLYRASPLLNYCQLVVLTVEKDARDGFWALRRQYREVIDADEYLAVLVGRVAEAWFPSEKRSNPLEDMMKSLFGPPPQTTTARQIQQTSVKDLD